MHTSPQQPFRHPQQVNRPKVPRADAVPGTCVRPARPRITIRSSLFIGGTSFHKFRADAPATLLMAELRPWFQLNYTRSSRLALLGPLQIGMIFTAPRTQKSQDCCPRYHSCQRRLNRSKARFPSGKTQVRIDSPRRCLAGWTGSSAWAWPVTRTAASAGCPSCRRSECR